MSQKVQNLQYISATADKAVCETELFHTGSQSPSSLWLILVNPVVKMFPSLVKMALIGRIPSCGARRSCWSAKGQTVKKEIIICVS